MDISTIIGLLTAIILIVMAMGSSIGSFIDTPSLLIVVGGTIGAIFIRYPLGNVFSIFKIGMKTVFTKLESPDAMIKNILSLSVEAKKNGILGLEKVKIDNAFLKKGVQLAIDGVEPELIEAVLKIDVASTGARHEVGIGMLAVGGDAAPAFGMIGTLVGLVLMLGNMDDPKSIGPAMSVALLTTLYGSILANVFFLPLSDKLSFFHERETELKSLIISGILSIANGDHPAVVQEKLASFLQPKLRASIEQRK